MSTTDRLLLVIAGAALCACGPKPATGPTITTPPGTTGTTTTGPGDAPGNAGGAMVEVGCRQMYVRCTGATGAGPTVLLDADWNESSDAWAEVQRSLSADARVCSYDRAGLGKSEADDIGPRSAQVMVYDLVELLAATGESGPFVLVADGSAAATARVFASQHADRVAAVVLLGPDRRHAAAGGEAFDVERSADQARAAVIADTVEVIVVPDGDTGAVLKEKPAEVVETVRRLVRAGPEGGSAAR